MVVLPPLLVLPDVDDYRQHYTDALVSQTVYTFDHIRVRFHASSFGHAFFESANRRAGDKSVFARPRAERMPWIRATLESPEATVLAGWLRDKTTVSHDRRAVVVVGEYAVIISLGPRINTGTFVTAFPLSHDTAGKLLKSPPWDRQRCRWR